MPILVAALVLAVGTLAYITLSELYTMHVAKLAEARHCPPNCATCALTLN